MKASIISALNTAKRISLFGYGTSNRAVHRFLKERYPNASVTLRCDGCAELSENELSAFDGVYDQEMARAHIDEDVIFLSPTVRRDSLVISEALERGVAVSSDLELFFELNEGDCIGITGSDGKSSTSYLTANMLSEGGRIALPLGNFGKSPLDTLGRNIYPVLELSSFQLMNFSPKLGRACITNISRNHLNWHKDYSEYINAKLNILKRTENAVLDYDSPKLKGVAEGMHSFAVCSSLLSHEELTCKLDTEHTVTLADGTLLLDGKEYISLESVRRKESYNLKNYMLAVGLTLGVASRSRQSEAISSFAGLAHRCELVDEICGVRYYNSSIDTSQKRTVSTLSALSGEVTLILSGRPKTTEVDKLAEVIRERNISVVLFGECEELYERALLGVRIIKALDMQSAVESAALITKPCGAVLLSPSCTSFDLYKSFEERGEDFRKCVLNYKRQGKTK